MATFGPYSTSNKYINYQIVITEGGVSGRNRVCNVKVQAWRTNSGYTTDDGGSISVTINGVAYSNSWVYGNLPITQNSYTTFFNQDVNVPCDVYGNGTISVYAQFNHEKFTSSNQGNSTSVTNIGAVTYWTNINVLNPDDVEISTNGAYFDLKFSDGTSYANLTNEPVPAVYKPYGTVMTISNIRPFAGYALEQVTGATNNGNGTYSKTVINGTDEINIHLKVGYTKCGTPTNLSITDNGDNTFTVKGIVGSNGTQNNSTGIKICGVYNSENIPTTSNYDFGFTMTGTEGTEVNYIYGPILPNSLAGEYDTTLQIIAYTVGSVSGYDSDNTSVISGNFKYYSEPGTPVIIRPSIDMTHAPHNFTLEWEQPSGGINNPIEGYTVSLECISPEYEFITAVSINDPEICGYEFDSYLFEFDKQYQFRVQALGENSHFNSDSGLSSILNIIDLQPFNDLNFKPTCRDDIKFFDNGDNYTNALHISDDIKRWLLMISWDDPEGFNNSINEFDIYLLDTDNNQINYWQSPRENRGLSISSEHILKESITSLFKEFILKVHTKSIYTDDYFNYDNISEFLFRVYPASGMYINTANGIKRAIGFKRLEDGSWIPLRELYYNNENNWVTSDINN